MAQRIIKASFTAGTSADLKGGSFATLGSITSDTGAVSYGQITNVTLKLTAIRVYATNFYLKLISGTVSSGALLAQTGNIAADSTVHESTFTLSSPAASLLTGSFSGFMLGVVATSGTGNKINFRDNCEAEITVTYTPVTAPTPPTSVSVSSTNVAPSTNVILSWSGAQDGSLNAINGYEIWRSTESGSGYTKLSSVAKGTTSATVTSPGSPGSYYYKILPIATNTSVPSTLSSVYATLTTAITAPGAPTTVSAAATNVAPGASVKISWSGATNGTNNPINGYEVWRSTSSSGSYEKIATLGKVTNTNVTSPSGNSSYYYKIKPIATNSSYPGSLSSNYATVTTSISAVSAPSAVTLDANNVAPETSVVLRWSGAANGTNNPINGYKIYRATSATGSYTLIQTVGKTVTSLSVTSPASSGSSYYYKVQAMGTYSGWDSGQSSVYGTLTTTVTAVTAPTGVSVDKSSIYPGEEVTVSWSGAGAGTNNPVKSYEVYGCTTPNGTYTKLTSTSATSYKKVLDIAVGTSYYFKIKTIGTRSGYDSGLSQTYATVNCVVTACAAPGTIELDHDQTGPGARVNLTWSGASDGTNNPIAGYEVHRSTTRASGYSLLATISSSSTSGTYTVTAPTQDGVVYYYKIITKGTRSGYDSQLSTSYASLECDFASVGEPTNLGISLTNVAPGQAVTLSWSGASDGTNNPIAGYKIFRATDELGPYDLLSTLTSSDTAGTLEVQAPTTNGAAYWYKVQTIGTLSGADSPLSDSVVTVWCTYSAPTVPAQVRLDGSAEAYVLPGEDVTLTWAASSPGANNPLASYTVYRDGVSFRTGIDPNTRTLTVPSQDTEGNAYAYTVQAVGQYSSSPKSAAAVVKSYTDPEAPDTVVLSEAEVAATTLVTLSWSGAVPGGYNAITGYKILRSEAQDDGYQLIGSTDAETLSLAVEAPPYRDSSYYFRVIASGAHNDSDMSEAYAQLTAISDPPVVSDDFDALFLPTHRKKRGITFGTYRTQDHGWTLTGWSFDTPEPQTRYVDVPFRADGPLDASTAMTDGDIRYGARTLNAAFECSEGKRPEREKMITAMLNQLHGQSVEIILPDDPDHYAVGRLSIVKDYSDLAHCGISVSAVCQPWLYAKQLTARRVIAGDNPQRLVLLNTGRKRVVPEITVAGFAAEIRINLGDKEWTLREGTHKILGLALAPGNTTIEVTGIGTVDFTYREASL